MRVFIICRKTLLDMYLATLLSATFATLPGNEKPHLSDPNTAIDVIINTIVIGMLSSLCLCFCYCTLEGRWARQHYLKAIKFDPNDALAHLKLADILGPRGRIQLPDGVIYTGQDLFNKAERLQQENSRRLEQDVVRIEQEYQRLIENGTISQ